MFYPSGIFRMKARAVLKDHWQTALLIALIVNLPTLLMQGFSAFTGNDLIPRLNSVLVSASRDGVLTQHPGDRHGCQTLTAFLREFVQLSDDFL